MMATLQNYEESEKGTKKTFAPPTQKPHIVKPQPKSWKEETLGTSSPEAEAKPSRPKASSKKREQKTATEHGPSGGQEKKQKAQDKPAEKKGKSLQEKPTLTNAEFEEIFQSVLQKSLQECLETSCAQPIIPTKSDREPGIAPSADNENADGEKVIVPDTPEIASSLEEEVSSETRTSKSGQPVTEPSKKKFNRLFSSKRKKKAEDEKIQDGHECSLKAKQKTMIQDHSQIRGQQKEEEGGFGQCLIWVQCSSPKCEKWRQLRGGIDPSVLPDNWSCDQNPDLNYNRCDIPEETWTGCESDVAYASYVPGSIIWAKQYGYPWWPGMIESDPDLGEYFLFASHLDSLPSKYHVTYFGETVSRAWIPVSMLKNFQELSLELARVKKCKNKDYGQKLEAAIRMAHKAEQISVQERVNLFGFWSRYNGSDGSGEGKDLMVCEPSRPECCLEKEKDSEEEKEEKEEKKDPTLPRPKPAKIQTKKTKSRGPKKKFKTPESKASATELPKEKAIKTDSKCPAPPAPHGACPLGKEGPGPQEPLTQEAASFPPEDDGSSDLDLEQLMEDIGEAEERGESQQRDGSEEFLAGLFEE
ncbi:zinc finger CW-type PWWP domain protein 1 isoform X13 [Peromyscus maniculatus bairdii]|uniref:zinc finger CW-type PWWP domain protein 1 isoform X13 n=1 Tax=Peromyscus maniculatus bairdii TaxID=230844 RepID=UPI003FD28BC2